jgi:hypothetical protein
MDREELVEAVAQLLTETSDAHHEAFHEHDGDDPEWPLWYAEYLLDRLEPLLDADLTRSELVYALVRAERERRGDSSSERWPEYYGGWLVDHYA